MHCASLIILLTSLASVWAASIPVPRDGIADWDAIIVGGGPAGLAALSGLARVRRRVLLIDSGVYRNGATRHMHDVPGFDGVTPAYYRYAAREQLTHYPTVTMTNGTVTSIKPLNSTFVVSSTSPSGTETTHHARKIVLATGLRDVLPETPGVKENWGKGIFWCPWCDGHEHADQGLGLLAGLDDVPGLVREMATLNRDVVAFVNGSDTASVREELAGEEPDWELYLQIHNVTVYNESIAAIHRLEEGTTGHEDPSLPTVPEHDLFEVELENGETVERAAFLATFPDEQASSVGEDMGVALYGGRLAADQSKGLVTNVPGVYAVGDANSDNVTNVPHALFSGKRTAVYLHVSLERETAAEEIEEAKEALEGRGVVDEEEMRALWERVNGEEGEILYAGEFDQ